MAEFVPDLLSALVLPLSRLAAGPLALPEDQFYAKEKLSIRSHFEIYDHLAKSRQNVPEKMGVQKKTRKFATVKRIIGQRDARLKKNQEKAEIESKKKNDEVIREVYGPISTSATAC